VTIDNTRSQIDQLKKQEADLTRDLAKHEKAAADARSDAASKRQQASRSKSPSMVKSYTSQAERYESKVTEETKKAANLRKKLSDVSKSISTKVKTLRSAEETAQRTLDNKDKARRKEELAHAQELRRLAMPQIRYIPLREPEPEKLRVLYLTANPEATETVLTLPDGSQSREGTWLRTEREVRSVQKAIRGSKFRDLVEIHHMPAATSGDILEGINDHRPHVIHFSGHAGGEALLMEDEDDDSFEGNVLEFDILAEALAATTTPPSLIVLNGCETLEGAEVLLNAAPVIIAMSDSISDAAATIFSTKFYAAIASAQSVGAALAQGRVALRMALLDEELTPQHIARDDFNIDTQVLVVVTN
jgi:hypothetical protein